MPRFREQQSQGIYVSYKARPEQRIKKDADQNMDR